MQLSRAIAAVSLCALMTFGCSMREVKQNYDSARNWVFDTSPTASPTHLEDNTPLIELNYEAADRLDSDLWLKLSPDSPIYYQPFTNLAAPSDPAPFGRVVADQVAARLAQSDLNIVTGTPKSDDYTTPAPVRETQLPPDADITDNDTTKVQQPEVSIEEQFRPVLPSLLTGTYLLGDDMIFVSAQITTKRDGQLISSYQWTLPINQNTRMLLPQLMRPQRGLTPTVQTSF